MEDQQRRGEEEERGTGWGWGWCFVDVRTVSFLCVCVCVCMACCCCCCHSGAPVLAEIPFFGLLVAVGFARRRWDDELWAVRVRNAEEDCQPDRAHLISNVHFVCA